MGVDITVDVRGRVANIDLKPREALLPLYEAFVNSVHAIEDSGRQDGSITVRLVRDKEAQTLQGDDDSRQLLPIRDVEIVDNGVGFNHENFSSFLTSDSTWKRARGGKGVGRFLWLKAFREVEVESTYRVENGYRMRRFGFSLDYPGIVHDAEDTQVEARETTTTVRLRKILPDYEAHLPKQADVLARRLLEHALKYFVLGTMPVVRVIDDALGTSTSVNDEFDQWVVTRDTGEFSVGDQAFHVLHFLLDAQPGLTHKVSFCGNDRVVEERRIDSHLPNLPSRIRSEEQESSLIYSAYVSSTYLDNRVNQSRTEFSGIAQGPQPLGFPDEISFREITDGAIDESRRFLEPYIEPVRVAKTKRIRQYILERAPQYRPLLKSYSERLESIPAELSDDRLDTALYEIHRRVQIELRKEAQTILEEDQPGSDRAQTGEAYARFLEEWNDFGKANLASYIVHRKVTLELLKRALERDKEGKFALESAVHELIFPLNRTSDTIDFESHNLWLVDEKLAYHYYLASDISLKRNEAIASGSQDRPDLLILNTPVAVADEEAPYASGIVIVEFKRPMRDDYEAKDNPIQQVYNYVRKIRSGGAERRNGRTLQVTATTPFFCYVVCDITPTLRQFAEGAALQLTPDRQGYFGWNPALQAYVEVIDFEKLVSDAEKRNRIMFDKLGLSGSIPLGPQESRSRSEGKLN